VTPFPARATASSQPSNIWISRLRSKRRNRKKLVFCGASGFRRSKNSFLRAALSSKWFAAGVISLVLAGMLFGAALMLYSHRGISRARSYLVDERPSGATFPGQNRLAFIALSSKDTFFQSTKLR